MLGFCTQRLHFGRTASLLRGSAKKLSSYLVKNKVMCLQIIPEASSSCGFLKPQHSALYSQNVPVVSMDEPYMKKYLDDLIESSNSKNWKRPHYWHTFLQLLAQRETIATNISSLNELEQGICLFIYCHLGQLYQHIRQDTLAKIAPIDSTPPKL